MEKPKGGHTRIALIGMPASGKSTVGLALSKLTGLPFVDLDELIEKEAEMSIAEIFTTKGEAGFRQIEAKLLAELSFHTFLVLATGGGTVESEANRVILKNNFYCVWLNAEMDELYNRSESIERPLLKGDRKARLKELAERRYHLYKECSSFITNIKNKNPEEIAGTIYDSIC